MLRDVVVHLANDQPLLADLYALPRPSDASLVCTNLRTMSGKTPPFVASGDSTFLFPLLHVRFVEVPAPAVEAAQADEAGAASVVRSRQAGESASGNGRRSSDLVPAPAVGPAAIPAASQPPPEVTLARHELAAVATAFAELTERPAVDPAAPPFGEGAARSRRRGTDDEAYTAELLRKIREA